MKGFIALTLAATVLAVTAAQANAAQGPTPAQFKALQAQVKTLQAQTKKLQDELTLVENATTALLACQDALIADTFQGTWNVIDQIAQGTQQKMYFGPQIGISDSNTCSIFKLGRVTAVPPTVAIFSSLVTLLTS